MVVHTPPIAKSSNNIESVRHQPRAMEVGFGTLFNKVNLILITEMIYRPAFKVSGQRRRVDPNSVVESVV
jgi:hypothetical protein